MHFYRDNTGLEVDLVIDFAGRLTGVEVKASATARNDQSQGLEKLAGVLPGGLAQRVVVYDGDEEFEREGVRYLRPGGLAGVVRQAGLGG
jgi:predicted AAA+ superfamily ATPase